MSELIAQYGSFTLPVIDVVDGVPIVWFEGRSWAAGDLRVHGQRLEDLECAPTVVAAPAGLVAEFLDSFDPVAPATVVAYPVLAIRADIVGSWADMFIAIGNEIDLVSEREGDTHRYLGCRIVGAASPDTDAAVAREPQ